MGNYCCEPTGPGSARKKRNMAPEPPSDSLVQEIDRKSMISFLSKQRIYVSQIQIRIRRLNADLLDRAKTVPELVSSRAKLYGIVQSAEEDSKLNKGIIRSILERVSEHRKSIAELYTDARKSCDLDDSVLMKGIKIAYFRNKSELVELLIVLFIKYFAYRSRRNQAVTDADSLFTDMESGTKALFSDVETIARTTNSIASELLLSKTSTETELDQVSDTRFEENSIEALFRLYEQVEMEVGITRKESSRLLEFSCDLLEEIRGVRKQVRDSSPEDDRIGEEASAFFAEVREFMETQSSKLQGKVDALAGIISQRESLRH